jgi:superfamily II DNA or RNA helicase/DNA-directed RNA polymerase specialized sigma24 family protein
MLEAGLRPHSQLLLHTRPTNPRVVGVESFPGRVHPGDVLASTAFPTATRHTDRTTMELMALFGDGGGLREYQSDWMGGVIGAIKDGEDRGIIRAPYQTGKTRMVGPLAHLMRTRTWPGKKVLVITPFRIITDEILGDLATYPEGPESIGVIQSPRRDVTGDHAIVVASAHTLGREAQLDQIDPNEFGLVIIDEATYALAPTWQNILTRFGFLDADRNITRVPGKFLLGLTADPFSLQSVFGKGGMIKAPALPWFMHKGYLHTVASFQARYQTKAETVQLVDGSETIVTIRDPAVFAKGVVEAYQQHLPGKRTLVHVATIAQANAVEAAFAQEYGAECAKAVHSETSDADTTTATTNYSDDSHPLQVLISIWKLAYGYRAKGTQGQLFTYESNSLRRTGQRVGRGLGVFDDEAQREILCVFMGNRGGVHQLNNPASLPRLFGIFDHLEDGIVYRPMAQLERTRRPPCGPRNLATVASRHALFTFQPAAPAHDLVDIPQDLPRVLGALLRATYHFDLLDMADAAGIDMDQLDRMLYGELPTDVRVVQQIEQGLQLVPGSLVAHWLTDALRQVDGLYPIPLQHGPVVEEWITQVRRGVLLAGSGSIRSALLSAEREDGTWYRHLTQFFKGELPRSMAAWHGIAHFLVRTGIASSDAVDAMMLAALREAQHRSPEVFMDRRSNPPVADGVFDASLFMTPVGDMHDLDDLVASEQGWSDGAYLSARTFSGPTVSLRSDAERLRRALATLTPKEEKVLRMRFGIGEKRDHTLEEVGQHFFLDRERVRQIERKARHTLRRPERMYLLGREPMRETEIQLSELGLTNMGPPERAESAGGVSPLSTLRPRAGGAPERVQDALRLPHGEVRHMEAQLRDKRLMVWLDEILADSFVFSDEDGSRADVIGARLAQFQSRPWAEARVYKRLAQLLVWRRYHGGTGEWPWADQDAFVQYGQAAFLAILVGVSQEALMAPREWDAEGQPLFNRERLLFERICGCVMYRNIRWAESDPCTKVYRLWRFLMKNMPAALGA